MHARRRSCFLGASIWFFILAISLCAFSRACAETFPQIPPTDADSALHQIKLWIAWAAAIAGTARLFLKPFQNWFQGFLTALVARVNDSPETDDDEMLEKIFVSPWYRIAAFFADYLLSLKLPTSEALKNHRLKQAINRFGKA